MAKPGAKPKKAKKQRKPSEDDLEDEEEDDEEYDAEAEDAREKKKRRNVFVDDAAEEEGGDGEDQDEDDDEEGDGKRGKKRLKRSRFVDDIAAVDEDDEDEEEEDDVDDLIHDEGEEVPEAEDVARRYDREAHLRQAHEELDAEQLEAFVRERFGGRDSAAIGEGVDDGAPAGTVGQQGLLPTHADPKLWIVETRTGEEREAVIKLLQKAVNLAGQGRPLLIKSAFTQDHLKGYIYIEAFKESHVKEAIQGLRCIYSSKGAKLVPMKEVVDAITVNRKAKASIDEGSWVRVRTALYKGDLAKVVDADYSAGKATVKIVPRLDYAAMALRRDEGRAAGQPFGRPAGAVRPPARAFSPGNAKEHRLVLEQKRKADLSGYYYLLNGARYEDGYLIRSYALKNLSLEEGLPPLEDLQRFNQVGASARASEDAEGGELAQLMESLGDTERVGAASARFGKGDKVIVTEGDLKQLLGRVTKVLDDGRVEMMPTMEGLNQALVFEARQLQKYFQAGDHVRVGAGQHEGQTGMVVRVEDPISILLCDATREELRVFTRDLSESAAAAPGLDTFGAYELHDLLALKQGGMGVLISVAKDSCKVLLNKGTPDHPEVQTCRAIDIVNKINPKQSTQDYVGKPIAIGDIVDFQDGKLKGKGGTVKYVVRGMLFLQVRELLENGGFCCVPARRVRARGGAPKAPGGLSGGVRGLASSMSSVLRSPMPYTSNGSGAGSFGAPPSSSASGGRTQFGAGGYGGGRSGGGFGGGRGGGDRRLEGRSVTICAGPYKGYKGRIIQATDAVVRVELEAQCKTVNVKRNQIPPEEGGAPLPRQQQAPAYLAAGSATPHHLSMRTPMHGWGSQTPLHPAMTPMHAGSATPMRDSAWNPSSAPTPRHPSQDNPASTPAAQTPGGDGWGAGGGAGSGAGTWNAPTPSYTPAYTPADTPAAMASTPGLTDPGTPGYGYTPGMAYGSGYTPVAGGTPAVGNGATPGFYPQATPAAGDGVYYSSGLGGDYGGGTSGEARWGDYEGVAVRLRDSGRVGIVQGISPDGASCTVTLGTEDAEGRLMMAPDAESASTAGPNLELLQPRKKDAIRVLGGADALRGMAGQVLNITESEAIVKLSDGEMKVLDKGIIGLLHGAAA